MSYLLQFDGASEPNPGPSGGAYVLFSPPIQEDNQLVRRVIQEGYQFLPHATNNEAEYTGLILGLQAALQLGIQNIEIEGDSALVVNQVQGLWKVKAVNLAPYRHKAANLFYKFKNRKIQHIPRDLNEDADRLSIEAIQAKKEVHRKDT